jgi:dipeptidyl aminopeptidase/acylaminoacyl peptidase
MEGLIALRRGLPARAAVWRGGLYDLESALADRPDLEEPWSALIPAWKTDRAAELARRSGALWADELHVPMLLVHGRQDWRSALRDAEAFDAALEVAGVEHRLVIYDDDEHQLAFHRAAWLGAAVDWFNAH